MKEGLLVLSARLPPMGWYSARACHRAGRHAQTEVAEFRVRQPDRPKAVAIDCSPSGAN